MKKRYVVRLTEEERGICQVIVKKLKGSSQRHRRAQMLLKADENGAGWTDEKIAESLDCWVSTVEKLRMRLVQEGFEVALNGRKRAKPPTARKLDGEGEAKLIALRLGEPPKGYGQWTLRLLANELVVQEVVSEISHETVRKALKKRG
jgi:transposase